MNVSAIQKTYYTSLILFSGAILLLRGFAYLSSMPVLMVNMDLGYPDFLSVYIEVFTIAGVICLWLMPVKVLKELAFAGFFIFVGYAIFSQLMKRDPAVTILFPLALFLILAVNFYCYYRLAMKKKSRHVMRLIHKRVKGDDTPGEISCHYSDAG